MVRLGTALFVHLFSHPGDRSSDSLQQGVRSYGPVQPQGLCSIPAVPFRRLGPDLYRPAAVGFGRHHHAGPFTAVYGFDDAAGLHRQSDASQQQTEPARIHDAKTEESQ